MEQGHQSIWRLPSRAQAESVSLLEGPSTAIPCAQTPAKASLGKSTALCQLRFMKGCSVISAASVFTSHTINVQFPMSAEYSY